jgi:hypothetical protein
MTKFRRWAALLLTVCLASVIVTDVAGANQTAKPWWERCNELPPNQIEACFYEHNGERPAGPVEVTTNCADDLFAVEPHEIGVSCDRTFKFYGVRWRSWGGRSAVGVGRARLQGCVPFCANGQVTRPRAKLRLTHIVRVEGEPVYGLLHYSLTGPIPRDYGPSIRRGTIQMVSAS